MDLGEKIRLERKKKKLSLKALASNASISKMTLQRIETGKTSPSIAVLGDIANALGTSITTFIEENDNPIHIIRKNDHFSIKGDGLFTRNILPRSALTSFNADNMAINYVECKSGSEVETHTNNGFEWVFQVSGKSILIYDGEEYIANEGDVFFYDGRRPHGVKYMKNNKFLLISFK